MPKQAQEPFPAGAHVGNPMYIQLQATIKRSVTLSPDTTKYTRTLVHKQNLLAHPYTITNRIRIEHNVCEYWTPVNAHLHKARRLATVSKYVHETKDFDVVYMLIWLHIHAISNMRTYAWLCMI